MLLYKWAVEWPYPPLISKRGMLPLCSALTATYLPGAAANHTAVVMLT